MKKEKKVAVILEEIRALGSEQNRQGMARYGINVENAYGVSVRELRRMAKGLGRDHELALSLWATGVHEARVLACFVDEPAKVTKKQLESWAADFDSWDLCDQATTSLFDRTKHAWATAGEWSKRDEEWVKRGGFSLMAGLAIHDKDASDEKLKELLPLIEVGAFDDRNFVKKAVSWALRHIGKRNLLLNGEAVACAERILARANERAGATRGGEPKVRGARWVAKDALRELSSEKVQARIRKR